MNNKGKNLGSLIKKRRIELKLSQDELALMVGPWNKRFDQSISNCERGKASISPSYFPRLLKNLQIDKKELLEAYCLDYIDMIFEEIKSQEAKEKRRESRKDTEEKDLGSRIESAKDAWKMLGLGSF